ncbi:MAG: hypothetical protein H7832_10940 [Magnetococcus sp. DMHC-6]
MKTPQLQNIILEFQNEHTAIITLLKTIFPLLEKEKISQHADLLITHLKHLIQDLITHLIREDYDLYPILTESEDPTLKQIGLESLRELGELSMQFLQYENNWLQKKTLLENSNKFLENTLPLLNNLMRRINFEEGTIFVLLTQDT